MLAVLLALAAPMAADTALPAACGPERATGCEPTGPRSAPSVIRVGKRCHPDPTKSKSCREVLRDQEARKDAALAVAR